MPDWKKLIEAKIALAKRGSAKLKKPIQLNAPVMGSQALNPLAVNQSSNNTKSTRERIPPGQTEVKNFPILDMGIKPNISTSAWTLRVFGQVEHDLLLDWKAFQALPQINSVSDFHCVTRWSQLDMDWQGVRVRDLLALAAPIYTAQYVTLHGYDGYTTNLSLEALLDDDVMIAHSVFGQPLTREHGGPARIIVPKRYAWKGAKWLKAIELHAYDRPGFWEVRGYHNDGFPFLEQRFSDDE